jgi:hypothetical protein
MDTAPLDKIISSVPICVYAWVEWREVPIEMGKQLSSPNAHPVSTEWLISLTWYDFGNNFT